MPTRAEAIKIKLRELDKLLEKKKITTKKYLDLKAELELQLKEKSVGAAKEIAKPKILNIICPNCGSPQKEVQVGAEEFNCEMCGKRIKLFDAEKEARRFLAKLPGLMENVALEQLFIEPGKFKIEAGMQREMAEEHLWKKFDPIFAESSSNMRGDLLNDCCASIYDSHGFRFLDMVEGLNKKILITLSEFKDTSRAWLIVPFYNTYTKDLERVMPEEEYDSLRSVMKYDDTNIAFWSSSEIDDILNSMGTVNRQKLEKGLAEARAGFKEGMSERERRIKEKRVLKKELGKLEAEYSSQTFTQYLIRRTGRSILGSIISAGKKKEQKEEPVPVFPWSRPENLEIKAKECFNIVKPLNQLANLLAIISAYVEDLKLNFFLGLKILPKKAQILNRIKSEEELTAEEKNKAAKDTELQVFGNLPPVCWANFFKGLASYAEGYGKFLVLKKESMEKNVPLKKLSLSEAITSFESASAAFERAIQNADKKRESYLKFYSRTCKALVLAMGGTLTEKEIKWLEQEKAMLTDVKIEKDLLMRNERYLVGKQLFTGNVIEIGGYVSGGKIWVNQRIPGLARMIEGPRFLFFVDVLLIRELQSQRKSR